VVTRKEQAAQSKALIIDVALRLFVEQGYEATSIGQIQEKVGMARGAVYHHFPDGKKEVFLAVVDRVDEDFHHGLESIVKSITSPVELIIAGFDLLLRLAMEKNFARIILIEASTVMPGAWAEGEEFALLRETFRQGIAAGELKKVPLDAVASSLYGAARRSADFVARSSNPKIAARDSAKILRAMIDGLRA
jgi:AcrR family transcriptional regulator